MKIAWKMYFYRYLSIWITFVQTMHDLGENLAFLWRLENYTNQLGTPSALSSSSNWNVMAFLLRQLWTSSTFLTFELSGNKKRLSAQICTYLYVIPSILDIIATKRYGKTIVHPFSVPIIAAIVNASIPISDVSIGFIIFPNPPVNFSTCTSTSSLIFRARWK